LGTERLPRRLVVSDDRVAGMLGRWVDDTTQTRDPFDHHVIEEELTVA
jgi:hypothetical protein